MSANVAKVIGVVAFGAVLIVVLKKTGLMNKIPLIGGKI